MSGQSVHTHLQLVVSAQWLPHWWRRCTLQACLSVASDDVIASSVEVSIGDVVLCGPDAGKVVGCIAFSGEEMPLVLVDVWVAVADVSAHSKLWRCSGCRALWKASHVDPALAWHDSDVAGLTIVLQR